MKFVTPWFSSRFEKVPNENEICFSKRVNFIQTSLPLAVLSLRHLITACHLGVTALSGHYATLALSHRSQVDIE